MNRRMELFIDGKWTCGSGTSVLEVQNPATESTIGEAPEATVNDVRRAIGAARNAFDYGPWPKMSVAERARIMIRMADAMERHADELVELSMTEAGSTRQLAQSIQTAVPIGHFRDMAERVITQFRWSTPIPPYRSGDSLGQGVLHREPYGVAALISASNFPFYLSVMKLAPALAAGCTVILKPAPTTPLESLLLGEMAEEAELPSGVLNIVTGDTDAGMELTTNPMVDIVSFTGSDHVGREVYRQAATTVKKVVLELGGKSATVICADADVARAARDTVAGITTHSGQGCALYTRTLVHESRYDELISAVTAMLSKVCVGDPVASTTTMGPLITSRARDRVESLVSAAVTAGADVVFGGGRPAQLSRGFFLNPTLMVGVDNSMEIAQTEIFGPVGVVIPFKTDSEATQLVNESPYGLAAAVWSRDAGRAYDLARTFRTGSVSVNGGIGGVSPDVAFGGYKLSGLGRERGEFGLNEFLQTKSVTWPVAHG
jgi:aldehyde dehydrogenase (NAD+)